MAWEQFSTERVYLCDICGVHEIQPTLWQRCFVRIMGWRLRLLCFGCVMLRNRKHRSVPLRW